MASRGNFWLCICVSIWTIIQTVIHAWWMLFGRKLISCNYKIRNKLQLYLYLTYFYSDDCDKSPLMGYVYLENNRSASMLEGTSGTLELHSAFQKDLSLSGKLIYMYLVLDAIWIIASVSLFTGTLMKMKECSAIVFFAPWIVVDVVSLIIDLFGAIYFGLQIPKNHNWIDDRTFKVTIFNLNIPDSAIMAIVCGRLGIIWIINMLFLILVSRATYFAWRKRYADERSRNRHNNNSAEERIKNWQQFYGVIDENPSSPETHLSYSSTFKDLEDHRNRRKYNSDVNKDLCSTLQCVESTPPTSGSGNVLKGHLPWSYISDPTKKPDNVFEERKQARHVFIKDDAVQVSRF